MDITLLKNDIKKRLEESVSSKTFFLTRGEDGKYNEYLANIEHNNDEPKIRNLFAKYLMDRVVNNEDLILKPLTEADHDKDCIYKYDYDKSIQVIQMLTTFEQNHNNSLDEIQFNSKELSNLFGYILYIGSEDGSLVLFKKHYSYDKLNSNAKLTLKLNKNNVKLVEDDLLRISGSSDFIFINDELYILNYSVLLDSFDDFVDLLMKDAKEFVGKLESLEFIADTDKIKEILDHDIMQYSDRNKISKKIKEKKRYAKKLSALLRSSPVIQGNISATEIIQFTKEHDAYKNKFKYSEDNKITLNSKNDVQEFLQLLTDDVVKSELTHKQYLVRAKKELK